MNTTAPQAWTRRRLTVTLAATATTAIVLLAGLGYTAWDAATHRHPEAPAVRTAPTATPGPTTRDEVAAAPMASVDSAAARPAAPATTPVPLITVPAATGLGPAGVPTGFPRTPAGALGQLAAIDATVLTAMDPETTQDVHAAWSAPGAPAVGEWVMTANVHAFTTATVSAGAPAEATPVVTATPVAAQVKGVDGPDWVLACVLLRVDATLASAHSMAYGHCERTVWRAGRWQIGPGAQPAAAPSTWPGTQAAADAGWRPWTHAGQD
ncbi:hypothetical protein [Phycicoccus flavus]|uniref:Uncharacterized protein n=1 Tax=Phycicoccus flavus TaxID=2502783 RepID=A0A8T6R1J5_9MICO|nr:hypothetical protein [Phycicoccus flavus]NHA68218.1 hypothetical protein [Phycicoccus flavus]